MPVCRVAGSDSVPDLGVSGRLGARFGTVFEGSVPDLGRLGKLGARFRGYGARFGHLFTVWCQIWVFGHRVVPDLGICSPCGARFGYFVNLWCQIWAFVHRVVPDLGIFYRVVPDLGTWGNDTRQTEA